MSTPLDLNDGITDFLIDCRAAGLSPKTIEWYGGNLRLWAKAIGAKDWWETSTTRAFLADLQSRPRRYLEHPKRRPAPGGVSPFTVRGYIRTLRRFFNWLVKEGRIESNPLVSLRLPKKPKRIPRGIEADDFELMLHSAFTLRDRALLLVLRDTACRSGEVAGMRIKDVDLEKGIARANGKGQKERFVYLNVGTRRALQAWIKSRDHPELSDWLFVSRHGPLTDYTIYNLLSRLAKRAGVTGRFNPHAFRHAFARDYLLDGGDMGSLSDLLGHENIETTKIYSSFKTKELQALHGQHSPARKIVVRGLKRFARPDGQRYLTAKDTSKRLKRSPSLVYALVKRGELHPYFEAIGLYGEILMCFKIQDVQTLIKRRSAKKKGRKANGQSQKSADGAGPDQLRRGGDAAGLDAAHGPTDDRAGGSEEIHPADHAREAGSQAGVRRSAPGRGAASSRRRGEMMEPRQVEQKLYGEFQDLRVDLYQALGTHQLSYDWLHALAGDVRQMLERVETEMVAAEQRDREK